MGDEAVQCGGGGKAREGGGGRQGDAGGEAKQGRGRRGEAQAKQG